MEKYEINKAISLGTLCHSSKFLKDNNLKQESYPFDWIFSNIQIVISMIKNDFVDFLNQDFYIQNTQDFNKAGHALYRHDMFNHFNPCKDEIYQYYARCVIRFRSVMAENNGTKLFFMMLVNRANTIEEQNILHHITELFNLLDNKTTNFHLLLLNNIVTENTESTESNILRQNNFTLFDFKLNN